MKTIAAFALALYAAGSNAAQLAVTPWFPGYGQDVQAEMRDTSYPPYLPATRYWRAGSTINVEFEYIAEGYFGARPDFGNAPAVIGELAPGSYTVRGKLFDIGNPDAAPRLFSQDIMVAPPDAAGVYVVPHLPEAFSALQVLVKGDYYLDPATVKASVNGNLIRVDYDYAAEAPAGGPAIAGLAAFASARIDGLAPGSYRVEGWARERRMGAPDLRYASDVQVGVLTSIIEYYADSIDHYYMSAGPDERLDNAQPPGFKRTGQQFKAWLRPADAPSNARPVCRFYSSGANSHFYTADPTECSFLKDLEQKERADAKQSGAKFEGWQLEGIAFYALTPQNGACPAGTKPVWRAYNNRAAQRDSNHRFTVTPQMRAAMMATWLDEGAAFCSPA